MAINLYQISRQYFEEKKREKERERERLDETQHLLSSSQASNEQLYDPAIKILPSNKNKLTDDAEKQLQRERNRNEQMQSSSSQTSTEFSNDPTINVIQSNQPSILVPRNVHLGDVIQPDEGENNIQQDSLQDNGNKVNINAALLSLFLYLCSIALVIYGSIHLNDCPAEKMVTISYIAMGCLLLCSRILSSPEECRNIFKKENNPQFHPTTLCRACLNFLIQIATLCFFFALCYWIFHMNPDTKEGSPNYCDKDLYKSAYYGCIFALVIFGLGLSLLCCGICGLCILVCKEA